MTIDVVWFDHPALTASDEYVAGCRRLRALAPGNARTFVAANGRLDSSAVAALSDADWLWVVCDSAIISHDGLPATLLAAGEHDGADVVVPSDARGFAPGEAIDFASLAGLERFVARLQSAPVTAPYDGRMPWCYLLRRAALTNLPGVCTRDEWAGLAQMPGVSAVLALRAFVHGWGNYRAHDRAEMLALVPDTVRSLLDVGGGTGGFVRAFAAARGGRACLLERDPAAAAAARAAGITVIEADFLAGHADATERFEMVSLLDVLEHFADPHAVLAQTHGWLTPAGHVLLSVPNVGHWSVVQDLLAGRFDYLPVGILCSTHLRFYTAASLRTLLDDCGFEVVQWRNAPSPPPPAFADQLARLAAGGGAMPDMDSLSTEAFHVLARQRDTSGAIG